MLEEKAFLFHDDDNKSSRVGSLIFHKILLISSSLPTAYNFTRLLTHFAFEVHNENRRKLSIYSWKTFYIIWFKTNPYEYGLTM